MGEECLRYHRRLEELLAMKKGEDYAKTMNWIKVKLSFSALASLRGCRSIRRKPYNIMDIDIQTAEGGIGGGGGTQTAICSSKPSGSTQLLLS